MLPAPSGMRGRRDMWVTARRRHKAVTVISKAALLRRSSGGSVGETQRLLSLLNGINMLMVPIIFFLRCLSAIRAVKCNGARRFFN